MNDEKERLEKELRFLKESLEANIISEEEYEKGKDRIEKRLDEIGVDVEEKEELSEDKMVEEEPREEATTDILEEVEKEQNRGKKAEEQESWVTKELKELEEQNLIEPRKEKPKETEEKQEEDTAEDILKEVEEEEEQKEPEEEPVEKKSEEKKPKKAKPKPAKQKKPEPKSVEPEEEKEETKPVTINRKTLRIIAIIAIIILFILIKKSPMGTMQDLIPAEEEFKPVCSTDEECIKSGEVGVCKNPDTKEAICEFYEAKEAELTVINDKTCIGCDLSKGLNFLKQIFPGLKETIIDSNTAEGKSLIDLLSIKVLPAFVFDSEINQTLKFERSKRIFIKKDDKYLVKPTVGSNYFFTRPSKPSTIDLFVKADQDAMIIDNSMEEVMGLFGNRISFTKHIVEKEDEARLERELAINNIYPTYLINNQLKFTGTQASEIIKNRFCYLNDFPECGTTLSLDIVTSD
ncbi:gas vesicle protein GvpG [Candidatus Woesearchaeota archaeon]|nr:gas vesicle protein GvpG [Candidatus Woesearchaeota archaeon]